MNESNHDPIAVQDRSARAETGRAAAKTNDPTAPVPGDMVKGSDPNRNTDKRPLTRRPAFVIFFVVLVVLAIAGTAYFLYARQFEDTDDAFIDGHVIPIMPQVPALVKAIRMDDNQLVKKGDVLVELDPTDYEVAVQQALGSRAAMRGKLEQARSGVPAARSSVAQAQAQLDAAQVTFDNTSRDLKRFQDLDERAKSQQQLDNATATQKRALADVEQAKAQLQSAGTQIITAQANVTAAEGDLLKADADVLKAKTNLGYCTIVASCDGRITSKAVDPGMYVTPSSQLFMLVPSDVWVTANFKETQLDRMQVGQHVSISVDAYPDLELHGTINSMQAGTGSRFSIIPAENATGNFVKVVQRVPVKITLDQNANADGKHLLAPGMSAQPQVRVR